MTSSPWLYKPEGKAKATLFRIQNRWGNQDYIACHDNRNVFRWGLDENDDAQVWLIVPAAGQNNRVRIYSKALAGSRVMAVVQGWADNAGRVEMWEPNQEDRQTFEFIQFNIGKSRGDEDWYKIKEFTNNEVLAAKDAMGNLRRWAWDPNDWGMQFRLMPVVDPHGGVPSLLRKPEHKPGAIDSPPALKAYDDVINETKKFLVGAVIVPFFLMKDPNMASPWNQFLEHPYYLIEREQQWRKDTVADGHGGWDKSLASKSEETATSRHQMTTARATEVMETTGWKVQGSVTLSYEMVEASVSSEYTHELSMKSSNSEELVNESTLSLTLTTENKDKRFIRWVLVDYFTVKRLGKDGKDLPVPEVLKEWQVVTQNVRDFSVER